MPKSRKRRAIHPFLPYAFITQCIVKHKDNFTKPDLFILYRNYFYMEFEVKKIIAA
jgi:hypothetical protein